MYRSAFANVWLLTDVTIGRHLPHKRFRDLDIVPEHAVVAHTQGLDSRFFALLGFDPVAPARAVRHDRPQLVDLGAEAVRNDLALAEHHGRVLFDRAADLVLHVRKRIQFRRQCREAAGAS